MRVYQQSSLDRINVISDEPIPSSFVMPTITVSILRHPPNLFDNSKVESLYHDGGIESRKIGEGSEHLVPENDDLTQLQLDTMAEYE